MSVNSDISQSHRAIFAIDTQELTKSFGARPALRGIDLKIKHHEFVVLLGPNGAGKTTLIKVLATIMNPSSGKIVINGLNLKEKAIEIHRTIGVVTHQTFLYGTLTAYENLEFFGRMYDIPRRKDRILEVIEMMGMTSRLHDRVDTFSRGMQQRLSIARALLHKPSIMLLDEPETGLDQQAAATLWITLQSNNGEKPTIIMITHNLEKGLELCNRHIILVKGKIVYDQSSQSLSLANLKQAYYEYARAEL